MKRKLITIILSVALTLTLIPTLVAYADDEMNTKNNPNPVLEDSSDEEDGDVDEEDVEGEDVEEEEDLPKINLKSPVAQFTQSEIGDTYTLTARVGEKVIDPSLITWTSDNEAIATVSSDGVVTIVGVGKANFTAVMLDGTARDGYAKVFVFADKTKSHKKHK